MAQRVGSCERKFEAYPKEKVKTRNVKPATKISTITNHSPSLSPTLASGFKVPLSKMRRVREMKLLTKH